MKCKAQEKQRADTSRIIWTVSLTFPWLAVEKIQPFPLSLSTHVMILADQQGPENAAYLTPKLGLPNLEILVTVHPGTNPLSPQSSTQFGNPGHCR